MSSYLMDSQLEGLRLEKKTVEEESFTQLQLSGLRNDMTALDVGCGTGAVSRVMCRIVGASGSVTAVDISKDRIEMGLELAQEAGLTNLRFQNGDVYDLPFSDSSFDFVWCRFVLEYLNAPLQAASELVRVAKPGSKVVLGDLDGNGVFHYPKSDRLELPLRKFLRALDGRFDPYMGRKLYAISRQAGLEDIDVHSSTYRVFAGRASDRDIENWETKFIELQSAGEAALGGRKPYQSFVREYIGHLKDPDTFTYSVLFLVQGRKPCNPPET